VYFRFISRLKSGTEISIRFAHYKTGYDPEPTILTAKTLHVEAKKKKKKKRPRVWGKQQKRGRKMEEDGEKCETRR
jgi:hypothetical protein